MTKFLLVLGLYSFSITSTWAADTFNMDKMPSQWEGVAGDMVVRVPAVLKIEKSKLQASKSESQEKVYEVTGSLMFGSRLVNIQKVSLRNYSGEAKFAETIEMTITTNDELVPIIFVMIVFDKKDNTYTMKDLIVPAVGRRLILRGI